MFGKALLSRCCLTIWRNLYSHQVFNPQKTILKLFSSDINSLVPYIIGVPMLSRHSLNSIRGEVLILDVDTDTITLPDHEVPKLPHEDKLYVSFSSNQHQLI